MASIRAQVGDGRAICGLSGGVDSAVAAAIVQRAIGDQLTCVFVDHGLLRAGEREQVERDFVAATGVRLHTSTRRDRFLDALAGVTDPETEAQDHRSRVHPGLRGGHRGGRRATSTSGSWCRAPSTRTSWSRAAARVPPPSRATTTSAGCPTTSSSPWSSPCGRCSRTRCARSAPSSGCRKRSSGDSRSLGPGLGIRIIGEVTADRIDDAAAGRRDRQRGADRAGLDRDIWQCPVVLLADVRSVGVQGDGRTYGHPIVLRPVSSEDAMTADWTRVPYDVLERISTRITNEVREVNRVVLDVTSKPPGTIEWE